MPDGRSPGRRSWLGLYLGVGLAFHVLYFGLPWPQHLATWLHVIGWPVYVVLGMLRRLFIPFAFLVLVGALVVAGARRILSPGPPR